MRRLLTLCVACLLFAGFAAPIAAGTSAREASTVAPMTVTVYVTKTGKKYHRGTCRYLRRSKISMKLSAARKRFSPCKVCRPPQ